MMKRILAFLMAVVMTVGLLPMSALATGADDPTVYISVSQDGQYVDDKDGRSVAYIPVSLSDLQAIDLGEYDLSEYDYNGQVTALHLYIYTHENIMGGEWSDVHVSGGAGSIFFEGGLFGFTDCNLQYYCNGEYPAVDDWGVTADQLVLRDGDFIDVAAYSSWAFYDDSATGFHYFLENKEITHEYTATAGEPLTITLGRAGGSMGGETTLTPVSSYTVSYGSGMDTSAGTVTTNSQGKAEITFPEAGTYYLWADGGYGADNPQDIVSSPAYAKVVVEGAAPSVVEVTDVTLDKETLNLEVGGSETLTATVTPDDATDKTVTWTSSDEGIAAVANGVVTAVATGEATITAKAGAQEDTCTVTVTAPAPVGTDPTVVYTHGNSTWGGMVYIKKATVGGVTVTDHSWEGNTCYVTLAEGTASTAPVTFTVERGFSGPMGQVSMQGQMVLDLGGTKLSPGATSGSVNLKGTPTEVVVSISGPGVSGATTKTFVFTIPNPNHLPALKDSGKTGESDTVTVDTAYQVNLGSLFTDEDGDALSYRVSIDGASAEEASVVDGIYTYNCPSEGDHTLVFTAVDSKGGESTDAYTVSLKVTPKNTSEKNYTTTITLPEGVTAKFYTLGGEEGSPEPGTALEAAKDGGTYAVAVPEGADILYIDFADRYLVTKAEADGSLTLREVDVSAKDHFGSPVNGTVTVTDGDGCQASAKEGSYYLAEGKTYTASFAPSSTTSHKSSSTEQEITSSTAQITVPVDYNNQKILVTPKGAKAQLFRYEQYYKNTEFLCRGEKENEDGSVSHYFSGVTAGNGQAIIYRVTYEDYIVKAGWSDAGSTVTVTYSAQDLKTDARVDYASSQEKNADYGDDSVLVNVNSRNHLTMNAGGSYTLKGYRAWEIIPVTYNNWIIEPDFHFNVVWESEEGVVSLADKANPMTGGESWQTLTANKSGTAIIEVTYDAIDIRGYHTYITGVYGASDPARTGLVVVTVGGSDESVNFGIDCFTSSGTKGSGNIAFNPIAKKVWDAEFDTLYFTGDSGKLQFAPTASSFILSVAVSNDKGESWQTLTAENGSYTADIVSGNNILRVTTENGTAYQIVRGDKVAYTVTEVDDKSDKDGLIEAGETVRITLDGLHIPIPKMAGNYNPGYNSNVEGNGHIHMNYTMGETAVYGPGAQYNFSTTANYIEVTIPKTAEGSVSLTDGYIGLGVIGLTQFADGKDSHRNIPDDGCSTRGSQTTWHTRSILPEITIELGEGADQAAADAVTKLINDIGTVSLDSKDAIDNARKAYDALTDAQKALVENYSTLTDAEAKYAELKDAHDKAKADQAAADAVIKLINDIGTVSLDSKDAIDNAREAYDALTDAQKALVENYSTLTDAEAKYAEQKDAHDKAKADQAAADAVTKLINDIGTVSLDSKDAIDNARKAYDALTDAQKALVENDSTLTDAEAKYDELKAQADKAEADQAAADAVIKLIDDIGTVSLDSKDAIDNAREAHNALTTDQKALVNNYSVLVDAETKYDELKAQADKAEADQAAADAVMKLIDDIGTVSLDSKDDIDTARDAYDALTNDQKALVENYNALTDAEAKYDELKAQADKAEANQAAADAVMKLIDDIGTVSLDSKDAIDAAREAYDALTDDQKTLVENLGVLEAAEEALEELKKPALTWKQVMAKTQAYLTAQAEATAPIVGSTSGEWLVLGLARAGVSADEDFFQVYYENVLAEEIDANGRLDANRSTENSRVILALTAIGKDVTNVGGHNLLQGLSDQDFVKKQGINGPVWALIALNSHNYEIPTNADSSKQVTREWLVDYILDNQLTNGGWKIQGQSPDDMTPMAIQALAPYYNSNPEVKAAVDKALTIMDDMAETTTSPETLAQIIVARSALGLDSEAAVAKLAALAQEDGSFKKGPSDDKANQMSTEQAFYGLVAYDRFQNEKKSLYDMTDVVIEKIEDNPQEEPIPVTGITLNKSTLTLEVGKTSTLTATVTPSDATDKTVTWTSSNSSVATVSAQGRVTAVAEGTARITATAEEVTASCVVTVTAQEVPLDFGLTESQIKGYVTVSFEDFGKRVAGESMDTIYTKALGTIIPATQVPYTKNDTIASVTIRLLDAMDYTSSYQGSVTSGFYLESIGNFTHKGTYYRSFGEFDAGAGSGWMITWNNWFIDKGASEFNVKNGDVIEWQYTCQLGADIGKDVSGDLAAVESVEKLIDAIGTVTKDSGKAIEAARTAYDALTADQKALVKNYSKLTAAEKTYAALLETDHPFTDAIGHWAEEAITFVYEKGLMTGTKADQFSPNTELSRAMLVTILYRMEGEPAVTTGNTFSDVKDGTWYTDAVIWAAEQGIVNGVGNDRFAPTQDITREQMAAMLLRYSDYKGCDTVAQNDLSGYTDAHQISDWALEALQWANAEGLITGRTANLLVPQGDTTRGETATILMRYLETIP